MPGTLHLRRILAIALALTAAQIALGLAAYEGRGRLSGAYQGFYQWDSTHYNSIAANGYVSRVPRDDSAYTMNHDDFNRATNVAFFPAYPLAARFVHWITGTTFETALIVTSQIFAVGFWAYLLLLLGALGISARLRAAAIIGIFVHPASFFLVAGYSESLFLMMLLGYIFWSLRSGARSKAFAALHGAGMTFTRIHGVFASLFPLLIVREKRHVGQALIVTLCSLLGIAAFFLFCEIAFGHWNLYQMRQYRGWGIETHLFFPFQGYLKFLPVTNRYGYLHPNNVSATLTAWTLYAFIAAAIAEFIRRRRGDARSRSIRIALWLTAFSLWYFYGAALAQVDMRSMVRYLIAPHLLMIIASVALLTSLPRPKAGWRIAGYAFGTAIVVASALLQWQFVSTFVGEGWVA